MSIEERLTKLERDNKTWRRLAIALAGVLGLAIACSDGGFRGGSGQIAIGAGQTLNPEVVHEKLRVRTLELMSHTGEVGGWLTGDSLRLSNERASLSADPTGLSIYSQAPDRSGVTMFVDKDAVFMVLDTPWNQMHLNSSSMSLGRRTPAQFKAITELHGVGASWLDGTPQEKEAWKRLSSRSHPNTSLRLESAEAGGGQLEIFNALGNMAASLQANKGNEGALYLHDVNGKTRAAY